MSGRPLRTASADAEAAVNSQLHNGPTPNKLPTAQLPTNSQRPTPNKLPKVNSQQTPKGQLPKLPRTHGLPTLAVLLGVEQLDVLGVGRWAGRWALIGTWALRSWELTRAGHFTDSRAWSSSPPTKSPRCCRRISRPRCRRDFSVCGFTRRIALASSVDRPLMSRSSTGTR